jgi:plasmid stabilization system protein ParE
MNVRHLGFALEDADEIEVRLDNQSFGLGAEFAEELRGAVAAITAQPRLHSPTEDGPEGMDTREYFIRRFGYRVIYAIIEEEVVVVAIVHAHRRPERWQSRLLGEW